MKKPKLTQKRLLDNVQTRDLFYTPKYATELIIPYIPKNIKIIVEPACGNGRMAKVFENYGYNVRLFDLDPKCNNASRNNFLLDNIVIGKDTAIITNPPYSLKKEFYKTCLKYDVPFALLIPADYCGWVVDAIRKDGCEKLIPNRRINFIPPLILEKVNEEYMTYFDNIDELPIDIIHQEVNSSGSMGHSMYLTYKFNLGKSEVFIDIPKNIMYNV